MRDKLINLLSTAGWNLYTSEQAKWEIADHLIRNGAKIPVRCEDCKHWDNWGFGRGGCEREYYEEVVSKPWLDNDFCSYGERKKQE